MSSMSECYVPQEVIVVEGRDDTKRLIETFGPTIKTIETNGSALNRRTLEQIKAVADEFGVIVLTDPDYQGERVRQLIMQAVPQAKHAYLTPAEADSGKKGRSLGIEHASPETIIQALTQVATPVKSSQLSFIPISDLIALRLIGHPQSSKRRQCVAKAFHLGHINGKQLQKRLATYGITLEQLEGLFKEEPDDASI